MDNFGKAAILGGCMMIAACGGGDGSAPATRLNFTVQGSVVEGEAADIEITVGSERFNTNADSNGVYSLELSLDEALTGKIVTASAKTSSNSQLHYVSVMGEAGALDAAAGSDNILTPDENSSVNISAVSTAISAQLKSANNGDISDQTALESAAKMIDSEVVFAVATSIILAMEYPDDPDLRLPSEVTDTYAFAGDLAISAAHGVNARSTNPDLWDNTQAAIAGDSNLVLSQPIQNADDVADIYYFTTPETSFSGIFNGSRLVLNPGGDGTMSAKLDESAFNWSLGESGVSFEGLELISNDAYPWDRDLGKSVHEQTITRINNLRWLSRGRLSDVLLLDIESYTHYPDGEYPDTSPVVSLTTGTALKPENRVNATKILRLGVDYSVPRSATAGVVSSPVDGTGASLEVYASKISFSGSPGQGGTASVTVESYNGDGTLITSEENASWMIAADGSLQISYANGDSANLVFLSENQEIASVNLKTTQNAGVFTRNSFLLLKEEPSWTVLSAPGIYRYPFSFFEPLNHFWFEVNDNGTALTVSTYDMDESGTLEDSEYSVMPGLWLINGGGNMLIRRYRYNFGGFCMPTIWDPADNDECVLYHEREWNLHQISSDDGYWIHHYHRFFYDWQRENMSDPTVSGHIFSFGSIDNRPQYKTNMRPVKVPPNLLP